MDRYGIAADNTQDVTPAICTGSELRANIAKRIRYSCVDL